jgi:hypothetical protein
VISENVLHATLIRRTRVSEAERHRDIAEHPERRDEQSRELVGLLHLYLMIPGVGIKEAEQPLSQQFDQYVAKEKDL